MVSAIYFPIIVHMYVFACALVAVGQSCVIWFLWDALYLFVTKSASQIPIAKSMGLAQLINKALVKLVANECQDSIDPSEIIVCRQMTLSQEFPESHAPFYRQCRFQTSCKRIVFQKISFQSSKNIFNVGT